MLRPAFLLGLAVVLASCFSEESSSSDDDGTGVDATLATTSATMTSTIGETTSTSQGSASADGSTSETADVTSAGSEGSSTTGPAPEDPYGRCFDFALAQECGYLDQCEEGCLRNYDDDLQTCTWQCGIGKECPAPLDGDAPAICEEAFGYRCILDCSAGQTCPTGMVCDAITNSFGGPDVTACAWPTTNWRPPYSRCFEPDCELTKCYFEENAIGCRFDEAECANMGDFPACAAVCVSGCGEGGECAAPSSGTAPAICVQCTEGDSWCAIDCSQGTCPDGMECGTIEGCVTSVSACVWPPA